MAKPTTATKPPEKSIKSTDGVFVWILGAIVFGTLIGYILSLIIK